LSAHSHNQSNNHASDFSYDLPADFAHAYDGILERTANETGVAPTLIHETLALMIQDGRWKIRAALDATTEFSEQFGCICFDAFSSRTSPELWSEDFLKAFFAKVAAPQCVLSTYACTGTLKRSLKASGFVITIREGFSSKRDSTFAVRSGQTSLN
jgi:tRNA U34 5-methylaminomethyl-2-thiouridine-forming methyltransferase MnmC